MVADLETEVSLLKSEKYSVEKMLIHLKLEPWYDGRSIRDGKRPWEQHVNMVICALAAERQCLLKEARELMSTVDERLSHYLPLKIS